MSANEILAKLGVAASRGDHVVRSPIDGAELGRALQLPAEQFVTFAQTVGYPQSA